LSLEHQEADASKDKISMIVSLMQTDYLKKRSNSRQGDWSDGYEAINVSIYKVKEKCLKQTTTDQETRKYGKKDLKEIFEFEEYLYQRELAIRLSLDPGIYVCDFLF